jgi:hypothetical protein
MMAEIGVLIMESRGHRNGDHAIPSPPSLDQSGGWRGTPIGWPQAIAPVQNPAANLSFMAFDILASEAFSASV